MTASLRSVLVSGLLVLLAACSSASQAPADVEGVDTPGSGDGAVLPADQVGDELPEEEGTWDYLIVAADDLWPAAEAFADYRRETGHAVLAVKLTSLLTSPKLPDNLMVNQVSAWVRKHYGNRDKARPFYLLLVGDAVESGTDPTKTVPVGHWTGGWEDCYSDNFYADMDYDHVPDLAVGRIAVASNTVALDVLERVKAHESTYVVGPWNRRLNVYAGEGGFGDDVDFFIETVAQKGLESVPYEYEIRFAYDNPGSNYYYAPFEEKVLEMVTDGALLVTFMGHGGGELDVPSLAQVVVENRQAMYAWFACSTGDFPAKWESDAETVFKQADGPMAVLVSSATTHPYANAVNALEMEASVFEELPETYGEAIRLMKWRSLYHESDLREMIDAFAVLYMPESEMVETLNDHMYSYNLLGDPAVRIRYPAGKVTLSAGEAKVGAALTFAGEVDNLDSGTAQVALVCERAKLLYPLEAVEDPTAQASWPTVQANWAKANDNTAAATEVAVAGGSLSGSLEIPATIPPGQYYLAVYAEDGALDAVGSIAVTVKK